LKGWFDRVFTNGYAFSFDENGLQGLLKGKRAMVVVTAGGTKEDFGKNADQLTKSTTEGTLAFCGITDIVDRVFYSVTMVDDDARAAMLSECEQLVADL
jgi:NAD(P)H dehydrogenase (quinone)